MFGGGEKGFQVGVGDGRRARGREEIFRESRGGIVGVERETRKATRSSRRCDEEKNFGSDENFVLRRRVAGGQSEVGAKRER